MFSRTIDHREKKTAITTDTDFNAYMPTRFASLQVFNVSHAVQYTCFLEDELGKETITQYQLTTFAVSTPRLQTLPISCPSVPNNKWLEIILLVIAVLTVFLMVYVTYMLYKERLIGRNNGIV